MRRKRLGFTVMAIVAAWLAIMPVAAHAQGTTTVMQGEGVADATGLEVSVLNLLQVTVDRAVGKFKVNTQDNTASTSGYAAALCNLGSPNPDPRGCTGDKAETTAATGGAPTSSDKCPTLDIALVTVNLACAKSSSKVVGAIEPAGHHEATLGRINVGLPLDVKALLTGTTSTVTSTVNGLASTLTPILGSVLPGGLPVDPTTAVQDVVDTLTGLLPNLNQLVAIRVAPAIVDVDSPGTVPTEKKARATAEANVIEIGLLGKTDALVDGLIRIKILPAKASATFNAASGTADCTAKAAVLDIKVQNLLGDGALVDLAPGLNLNLGSLLPITNGLIGVKLATATPDATGGKSCRAEARGLELNLLGLLNGGIQVRAAAANAEIAGAVSTLQVAGNVDKVLPTTGGPTSLFLAGGVLLAVGAFGAFRLFRKVQHSA